MDKFAELLEAIDFYSLLTESKAKEEKVYGPYSIHHDRKIVIIKDRKGKTRTVSYPKYLVEQNLGRKLKPNETVDHLNSDVNDNRMENLKVIDRSEHSKLDTRRVKLIDLKCSMCGKDFQRSPRLMRDKNKKGVRGIFCGRSCSSKYNRQVQLGLMDKLPIQPFMESEYYKNKHLQAFIGYLIEKYAF